MSVLTLMLSALAMLPSVAPASPWPVVSYRLRVDAAHLDGFDVEMHIGNAGDTTRLAMAAHPEYDDRYWRYVRDLHVTGGNGAELPVVREDSMVWRFVSAGAAATVRYRIQLPAPEPGPRPAWRPFLSSTGGLVGGPHAFMYVTSATHAPSRITLDLPTGWDVATGLTPRKDSRSYEAKDVATLMDSPMLVGQFRSWQFAVNGVPHHVAYWPAPHAIAFDTTTLMRGVEAIARRANALFRRAPYQSYTFIYQDNANGGLEHRNSVTLGAQGDALARGDFSDLFENTAHEYTHTWNLMAIRPAEYLDVSYRVQPPVPTLWFSEGLTIHYADLFLRQAALPTYDSTPQLHLERMMERYLAMPGNAHNSAEAISRAEYNAGPEALGDYPASSHLVGELLGTMMDLAIRSKTSNRRSMDDVMRLMLQRFSGTSGFTGANLEHAVSEVCGCDLHPLFEAHVRGAGAIDFARYLREAGLEPVVSWVPATAADGSVELDNRIRGWVPVDGTRLKLYIIDPASSWGRAGIHTGDELLSVNGKSVTTWRDFRTVISAAHLGDTLSLEIERPSGAFATRVGVTGYLRPVVKLVPRSDATTAEQAVLAGWMSARNPVP